jgi:hypothetical protein
MGRYVVHIVDADLPLTELQRVVRQKEQLNLELVCLTAGTANGQPANLATMSRTMASGAVRLSVVDGNLGDMDQSRKLDEDAGDDQRLLAYGGVWVEGTLRNVAITRPM